MKKLVLLISAVLLVACGGDNKKKAAGETDEVKVENNYTIVFQGIYEKDDEVSVQYKANGYFDYEHPVTQKITGQPMIQRVTVALPAGIAMENFQFLVSTNKEQKFVDLRNVLILNNGKELLNANTFDIATYFDANAGIGFDDPSQRFTLDFSKQFPPGFTGNVKLEALLAQ